MGRKKRKKEVNIIFCYYCNRAFDNEPLLIMHQKNKHWKCRAQGCGKKMNSAYSLINHMARMHKQKLEKIPDAKAGRDDVNLSIYGMENVPIDAILARKAKLEDEENKKRQKQDPSSVAYMSAAEAAAAMAAGTAQPQSTAAPAPQQQTQPAQQPSPYTSNPHVAPPANAYPPQQHPGYPPSVPTQMGMGRGMPAYPPRGGMYGAPPPPRPHMSYGAPPPRGHASYGAPPPRGPGYPPHQHPHQHPYGGPPRGPPGSYPPAPSAAAPRGYPMMPAGAGPGMQRGPSAPPAGAPGSTQPGQPPIMGMGRGHITPGAPGAGAHTLGMPARMGGMGRGRVMPGAAAGMAHAHIHGLAPSPHAVASGPVAVGASAAAIAGARKIATGNGSSTRVNDKEIVFIYKDDNDESMEEKRARLAKYRMQQKLPVPTQSISSISSQIRAIQARLNTA